MTGLPNDKMNQIPTGLVPPPALQPYNAQNTQPVIIQENYNNQMPQQIIYSDKYQALKNENHHGLSRYDHSLRVARNTYKLAKKMKFL